jgi:hypothetical protein
MERTSFDRINSNSFEKFLKNWKLTLFLVGRPEATGPQVSNPPPPSPALFGVLPTLEPPSVWCHCDQTPPPPFDTWPPVRPDPPFVSFACELTPPTKAIEGHCRSFSSSSPPSPQATSLPSYFAIDLVHRPRAPEPCRIAGFQLKSHHLPCFTVSSAAHPSLAKLAALSMSSLSLSLALGPPPLESPPPRCSLARNAITPPSPSTPPLTPRQSEN